jgi:hypothetical protein
MNSGAFLFPQLPFVKPQYLRATGRGRRMVSGSGYLEGILIVHSNKNLMDRTDHGNTPDHIYRISSVPPEPELT